MMASRFRTIVGTGGVGTGLVFRSGSNRTLGRNESRLASLTDVRDYCKLHIVFHYLGKMLSPAAKIVAASIVGEDEAGDSCIAMMERAGIHTGCIKRSDSAPTMQSMCLIYPDNAGCNVTAENSACNQVDTTYIERVFAGLDLREPFAAVALPEVPFEARQLLLKLGREAGGFCVTTVPSADAQRFIRERGFSFCDLLAINIDEAAALCGVEGIPTVEAGRRCLEKLARKWPETKIWMTLGKLGSLTAEEGRIQWQEALSVPEIRSTAGAGDAGLAGILCGLSLGLPFCKQGDEVRWAETPLGSAVEMGILFSGISIESADSIAAQLDWRYLYERISAEQWEMEPLFQEIVTEGAKQHEIRV